MHDSPAGIDPLLRLIAPLPAVAPVNVPLHVLLALGVLATCTPAGSVSLTATPASAVPPFGLVMVKLSVEVPPIAMPVGENALLIVGGPTTVTLLLQELFPSLVSGTLLLGSTAQLPPVGFAYVPAALAVAVKLTSKEPGAAMVTAPLAAQVRTSRRCRS